MTITVAPTSQSAEDKTIYYSNQKKMGKRRKATGKYNLVDRISALPDDILVSIVSFLEIKEAAATSILSRRWQNVWKYTMTLNLERTDFFAGDAFRRFKSLMEKPRYRRSHNYVDWVDGVLKHHRGQNLERFRACFFLDKRFRRSIDKWIKFAMEKRVEVLQLQFLAKRFCDTYENYTFPSKLLGLEGGYAIKSLKVIFFQQVGVTGEVLEHLLSNCPALERLSVYAAKSLVSLRVVGPSIALKYLVIKECPELKGIEICEANVVSFAYKGRKIDLLLRNVPLLVEVDIVKRERHNDFMGLALNPLSICLPQIKILKLDMCGLVNNENYAFPILENLEHLELFVHPDYDLGLRHLTSFMEASPYMQRLVLKLGFSPPYCIYGRRAEKAVECPHRYLKVVEIVGYRRHEHTLRHVKYLINNVVALEKIIVDPVKRWLYGPKMDRETRVIVDEAKARAHAVTHLEEEIPSTIEFVCL